MAKPGTFILTACAVLAGIGSAATAAPRDGKADPRTGTWKLNIAESIPPQGKTFAPFTAIVRSSAPDAIDFTYRSELPDGKIEEFGYQAKIDGVLRDLPGNMGLKGSMTPMAGGVILSKLIWPDGSTEDKICNMDAAFKRQICIGSMTSPQKDVVFFKQVLDKQD